MIGKTVVVTIPHDRGIEDAKSLFIERFTTLRTNFRMFVETAEAVWSENYCRVNLGVLGQSVTGLCEVQANELKILIKLPFLLSGLAGAIESFLGSHGDVLGAPPKSEGAKPMMKPLAYHHELLWMHRRLLGLASRQSSAQAQAA